MLLSGTMPLLIRHKAKHGGHGASNAVPFLDLLNIGARDSGTRAHDGLEVRQRLGRHDSGIVVGFLQGVSVAIARRVHLPDVEVGGPAGSGQEADEHRDDAHRERRKTRGR